MINFSNCTCHRNRIRPAAKSANKKDWQGVTFSLSRHQQKFQRWNESKRRKEMQPGCVAVGVGYVPWPVSTQLRNRKLRESHQALAGHCSWQPTQISILYSSWYPRCLRRPWPATARLRLCLIKHNWRWRCLSTGIITVYQRQTTTA